MQYRSGKFRRDHRMAAWELVIRGWVELTWRLEFLVTESKRGSRLRPMIWKKSYAARTFLPLRDDL
jgi:hypothetical protein